MEPKIQGWRTKMGFLETHVNKMVAIYKMFISANYDGSIQDGGSICFTHKFESWKYPNFFSFHLISFKCYAYFVEEKFLQNSKMAAQVIFFNVSRHLECAIMNQSKKYNQAELSSMTKDQILIAILEVGTIFG
jgi:hypothetical protein